MVIIRLESWICEEKQKQAILCGLGAHTDTPDYRNSGKVVSHYTSSALTERGLQPVSVHACQKVTFTKCNLVA